MSEITLTNDQQTALDSFVQFLLDPDQSVWVLRGYSGTGKSTLIHTLIDQLPSYIKSAQLLNPDFEKKEIQLTATTNKAAETFSRITGMDVRTIHSFLGLRVHDDKGNKKLVAGRSATVKYGYLLFIDEASMIDGELLTLIFQQTKDCKIVFIGDPAQLPPVKSRGTPVFEAGFPEARLSQVMRQMVDGKPCVNPITELSTLFRHTVETGEWPQSFKPDGHYVTWLTRADFVRKLEEEFTREDWIYRDSKVLAWTNNCVIEYNKHIRALRSGDPQIQVGDYVENNSYVQLGKDSIKTDQTVYVAGIGEDEERYDVLGNWFTLDNGLQAFHPKSRQAKQRAVLEARNNENWAMLRDIEQWVDLRAVFAQTINKSQGSTYGKAFIDLDDIKRCTNGNLIARLLYVGISRAQNQVYLTGDLV